MPPADTSESRQWQHPRVRCNTWESPAATHNDGITEHGNLFVVRHFRTTYSISGLVAEYIVAIDVTRARFPADACKLGSAYEHINTRTHTHMDNRKQHAHKHMHSVICRCTMTETCNHTLPWEGCAVGLRSHTPRGSPVSGLPPNNATHAHTPPPGPSAARSSGLEA